MQPLPFVTIERQVAGGQKLNYETPNLISTTFDECGSRPPTRRGHRGLRPGGNVECGRMVSLRFVSQIK